MIKKALPRQHGTVNTRQRQHKHNVPNRTISPTVHKI